MKNSVTGRKILLDTLREEGVRYVFGNPGTTELPLLEALQDESAPGYVMALQESVAVIMAEAYAQAAGEVGVVNLHAGPGLGNGLGAVYNAWEGKTPLVVTAGQQDTRLRLREPLLGHDLAAMAAPLVKWSQEARCADELALLFNRAFKTAREAPSGPVFLSLPLDVMDQRTENPALPRSGMHTRSTPDPDGLREAAGRLLDAEHPLIFCGSGVARAGAVEELRRLAQRLGAEVYNEVLPSRVAFPTGSPLYRGWAGGDMSRIRAAAGKADVVLLVAGEFFEEVWFEDARPFPEDAWLIQLDDSPANLGRNFPVHCGLAADPLAGLRALNAELERLWGEPQARAAEARTRALEELRGRELEQWRQGVRDSWDDRPISLGRLMGELKAALPSGAVISEEGITATDELNRALEFGPELDMIGSRGGGIGQAFPSALGIKLARPESAVLAVSGDGSALYTIQSLWSAAHHDIGVVFLVVNNGMYRILKHNLARYRSRAGHEAGPPVSALDLTPPPLDFVALARGFGVEAQRVEEPEALAPALARAFRAASGDEGPARPFLLDVVVAGPG
ncbi:MAG: thiamine pyrophosphate-binding protein [Deltaproteobacteria bacterium]|nr:thiamine pyrophosphate-binding protein [Deltaproteobacteria bacterium]